MGIESTASGPTPVVDDSGSATAGNPVAESTIMSIVNEIIYSPLNLGLVAIIAFLVYKIIKDRFEVPNAGAKGTTEPELPKLRRDFTVQELRQFDGTQPDGRVLVAVNGNVYDVTRGKRFYGPGGPYASFAGRDASRNLATFSVKPNDKDEYDDLSDLQAMEMESVREWELQFKEKYDLVGRLLRKGENPTNYEFEEDETNESTNEATNASTADQRGEQEGESSLRRRENVSGGGDETKEGNPAAGSEEVN